MSAQRIHGIAPALAALIALAALAPGRAAAQEEVAEVPMRGQIGLGPNGDVIDEEEHAPPGAHPGQLTEGSAGVALALSTRSGALGLGPMMRLRVYSAELGASFFWGLNLRAAWFPELSIAGGSLSVEHRALDLPAYGDLSLELAVGLSVGLFGAQAVRDGEVLRDYAWGFLVGGSLALRIFVADRAHRGPFLLLAYENGMLVSFLADSDLEPTYTPSLRVGFGGYW